MSRLRSRFSLPIVLVITLSLVGFQTACSTSALAKNADRVASAVERAQPAFQRLIDGGVIPATAGAAIISRCIEGAKDGRTLAQAFRDNNASGALDQTAALVRIVDQLIDEDAKLITDQTQRTLVLTILSAADLALGIISDEIGKTVHAHHALFALSASPQQQSSAEVVKRFASKPRLRCRDAKTGRFQKMAQCKAHPETTVVERVKGS